MELNEYLRRRRVVWGAVLVAVIVAAGSAAYFVATTPTRTKGVVMVKLPVPTGPTAVADQIAEDFQAAARAQQVLAEAASATHKSQAEIEANSSVTRASVASSLMKVAYTSESRTEARNVPPIIAAGALRYILAPLLETAKDTATRLTSHAADLQQRLNELRAEAGDVPPRTALANKIALVDRLRNDSGAADQLAAAQREVTNLSRISAEFTSVSRQRQSAISAAAEAGTQAVQIEAQTEALTSPASAAATHLSTVSPVMTIVTRSLADGAGAALLFLLLAFGVGIVRTSNPDAARAGASAEPTGSPEPPVATAVAPAPQSHTVRIRPTGPAGTPDPQPAVDGPGPQPAVDAPTSPPAYADEPSGQPTVPVGNVSRGGPSEVGPSGPVTWRGEGGID